MYFGYLWFGKELLYDYLAGYMWQMLWVQYYMWSGMEIVKSCSHFYVDSRTCFRVGVEVSEWFPINVEVIQGCLMSPLLYYAYMGGVVREVNAKCSFAQSWHRWIWAVKGLWYTGFCLQMTQRCCISGFFSQKLCRLVREFGTVCKGSMHVAKSTVVMKCSRYVNAGEWMWD